MNRDALRRLRTDVARLARLKLDWVTFSAEVSNVVERVVPFDRSCWHIVDPGTVLFTGNVNRKVDCSGSWLAEHEYVIDDVNKWHFLAHSGRLAGATSIATHGDLSRSARHRTQCPYGIGDELRGSFVVDGVYWGAAGFLRDDDRPWYTEDDVAMLRAICEPVAEGLRRALLTAAMAAVEPVDHGPGVIVFDANGDVESMSPSVVRWIDEIVEIPKPAEPTECKAVQAVAARARAADAHALLGAATARARVQTRSGSWLLLYGTLLAGGPPGRTAVILQPAAPSDVAPLVALAYGLTERESQVTRLCMQGKSTKQIAAQLGVSAYTVQDHLKSIFDKTGVRTRGELVGQVFLEHYVTRWEQITDAPSGWQASGSPGLTPAESH